MTDGPTKTILDPAPAADLRSLMARFPTGVAVVTTTDDDGRPRGMTCSSLCSVSLAPPTLLVSLWQDSPTLHAMLRRTTFAVNLLHRRAKATAELFASGMPHRFEQVRWTLDPAAGGPHLTLDAHATADCRVTGTRLVGDHRVVFGAVFAVTERHEGLPLLYGLREYRSWPEREEPGDRPGPGHEHGR
ncbi:flavin reductase family protein [Amycolatopsis pigmentata]|uniref:Flavin reductase family protein n=1 Tax=Amycolatopsis pigmentata TaxID=450801 RepID=A0ABW5FP08_9PSEU